MFGLPGGVELFIVLFVVLLLFGKRLPGAMNSVGKSIVEFKKGIAEQGDGDADSTENKEESQ